MVSRDGWGITRCPRGEQPASAAHLVLFSSEPLRIMMSDQAYIDELSTGALRGTNPTNPADRHNAVMAEAERIRDQLSGE